MTTNTIYATPHRHLRRCAGVLFAVMTVGIAGAQRVPRYDFVKLPGEARDIAVGANGALWVIGAGQVSGGYNIFRWAPTGWQRVDGAGVRIAVDPDGSAWVLNSQGEIYQYSFAGAPSWRQIPGSATEIAVGPDGSLWVIGAPVQGSPDRNIFVWRNQGWGRAPGAGLRIAAGPGGTTWVINSENEVYQRDSKHGIWTQMPLKLRSVGIGANGAAFGVSLEIRPGGNFPILQEISGVWVPIGIEGVKVAVGPVGEPYVLNAAGEIYRGDLNRSHLTVLPGDLVPGPVDSGLDQPALVLNDSQSWDPSRVPFTGGKLVCAGSECDDTNADWVGPYALDTSCDRGAYSTLYGGTCWSCPANDGQGSPWTINLLKLESEDGCWRFPYERYGKAEWVKFGPSWTCNGDAGEFWDTHDREGSFVFLGSCWKCPDPEYPRRTQYWIAGPQACATPIVEHHQPVLAGVQRLPGAGCGGNGLDRKAAAG
jgi:hypothetical protein